MVLTIHELNWMLDGFDLWRNRPHALGKAINSLASNWSKLERYVEEG